jgi:hypothetical protein
MKILNKRKVKFNSPEPNSLIHIYTFECDIFNEKRVISIGISQSKKAESSNFRFISSITSPADTFNFEIEAKIITGRFKKAKTYHHLGFLNNMVINSLIIENMAIACYHYEVAKLKELYPKKNTKNNDIRS